MSKINIPAGWKLVPAEPTGAMLIAARDWSICKLGRAVGNDGSTGCYTAMLAAAPTPPVDAMLGEPVAQALRMAVERHMTCRFYFGSAVAQATVPGGPSVYETVENHNDPLAGACHAIAQAAAKIDGATSPMAAPVASRAVQAESAVEIRDLLCELGNGVKASNWRLAERAFAMSARFLVDQPLAATADPATHDDSDDIAAEKAAQGYPRAEG